MLCVGNGIDPLPTPRNKRVSGHRTAEKRSAEVCSRTRPPAKKLRTEVEAPLRSKRHGQASIGSAARVCQLSLHSFFAFVTPAATSCLCRKMERRTSVLTLCGMAGLCSPSAGLLPCLFQGKAHQHVLRQFCRMAWLSND